MKIVHITQYFHPLKGYQENQLAKFHKAYFDRVVVIASKNTRLWNNIPKAKLDLLDKEYERKTGVEIVRLKTIPITFSDRVFCFGLTKTLTTISPDYIFAHSVSSPLTVITSLWINRYIKRREITAIVDDHMVYVASKNYFSSLFYVILRVLFLRQFLKAFKKWIAVSEETKEFIVRKLGKKLNKIVEVIPLGVDLKDFKYDSNEREIIRNRFKICDHTKLIVYTGKRDTKKDPFILLPVLKRLLKQGLDYKLLLVGENVNSYDSMISKYISHNVDLEGRVLVETPVANEELYSIYSAADCAVWPNQSSMSMLEAMACSCPVVASNIKVNAERLGDGRGVLFKNGEEESLFNAILAIDENRAGQTEKAYRWVKNFDWEKISQESIKTH